MLVWHEKSPSATASENEEDSSDEEPLGGLRGAARTRPGVMEGVAVPSSERNANETETSDDVRLTSAFAETDFQASNVSWAEDGQSMVLQSDQHFCLAYPLANGPQ